MAQEIEIEFKNILTEPEYNLLLQALDFPSKGVTQTNYYFETADFQLKNSGSALRIREKNDKFVLTLKEPHALGLLETHDRLTKEEATAWIQGRPIAKEFTQQQLDQLNISINELRYLGSLITERREIEYKNNLLVLDFSQYNQQADYELEMETSNRERGELVFKELLEEFQIPLRKTPNKIERFFHSVRD